MAMHLLKIRCSTCRNIFTVRRPNNTLLVAKIIPLLICPFCHPEQSDEVCGGCRLPFKIVGRHTTYLCLSCFWKNWRYNKIEQHIITIEKKLIIKPEADSSFTSTQDEITPS
jgi:hypothetical protein